MFLLKEANQLHVMRLHIAIRLWESLLLRTINFVVHVVNINTKNVICSRYIGTYVKYLNKVKLFLFFFCYVIFPIDHPWLAVTFVVTYEYSADN